ncbi:MAG: hypothetical protein V3T43_05640, partial [Nitrosomonadaceae bacterium]
RAFGYISAYANGHETQPRGRADQSPESTSGAVQLPIPRQRKWLSFDIDRRYLIDDMYSSQPGSRIGPIPHTAQETQTRKRDNNLPHQWLARCAWATSLSLEQEMRLTYQTVAYR